MKRKLLLDSDKYSSSKKTCHKLNYGVNVALIESNNGGRGFARAVESKLKSNKTIVKWFHQGENKVARILSNSAWVLEHIYMPVNWRHRWTDFCRDITRYQKAGKNAHDDAPDALTGVAEQFTKPKKLKTIDKSRLGLG